MLLDTLLGSVGTGGEPFSQNSGMGLNLGCQCFQSFLPVSQSEHSVPVLGTAERREKQHFLTFCCSQNHQAMYYKLVDFVHSIIQHEKEKVLVEDGGSQTVSKLWLCQAKIRPHFITRICYRIHLYT